MAALPSAVSLQFSLHLVHAILMIIMAKSNVVKSQTTESECLQANSNIGLPFFRGYTGAAGEPANRIHHQHQAIIPSYKFNCCGNITEWGVDLNPMENQARFSFDFQVWRPSPTLNADGCYSLVNNYIVRSMSLSTDPAISHVARVTPSPQDQLQFRRGDVLGFYVESHNTESDHDNGVVLLNNGSHTNELVYFASVDVAAQPPKSGSCPYPVGTSGVLTSTTHAAPVISISVITYSCTGSMSFLIPSASLSAISPQQTQIISTIIPSPQQTPTISMISPQQTPTVLTPVTRNTDSIIAGVVVIIIIVCIATMIVITILAIVITIKRHRAVKKKFSFTTTDSLALANQVYGAPERGHPENCDRSNHSKPPIPVRYTPGSSRVKTHTLDEELPQSTNTKEHMTQPGLYHAMGPDTSLAKEATIYTDDPLDHVYQYADAGLHYYSENTTGAAQEAVAYEIPRDELFDMAGLHVPTTEERSNWMDDYEKQEWDVKVYSKTQFFVEDDMYWAPASTASDLYSQLASKKYREICRGQIKLLKAIGSGEFGNVCKAVWSISGTTKEVAVKTLKPGSSENDRVRFLQEAAIMGQFNHPFVVKLYGVVTVEDPIMICIELMTGGDLRGYLGTLSPHNQSAKKLESQLLKFSRQIALGMAYLSKKAFVHRDLAARNILLDEALTCKISDFGMARDLVDDTYYTVQSKGGKIPVKWTAPEALFYRKYSTDSDVWSYGMVLFEIWSVGKKPFSEITNKEVLKKINSGYCQPPPPRCPRPIYQLMVNCWNPIHSRRPSFSKISATLNASSSTLLQWTGDHRSVVGELGGQLSEAQFLYQDLQNTYNHVQ